MPGDFEPQAPHDSSEQTSLEGPIDLRSRGSDRASELEIPRLLLIDDEPSVVNALRRALRREGYRIFTATSPEEGMRLVGQEKVDIVISDHLMPGMTGIELFTVMSRLHPQVRRIVLTGQADVDMAIRAINEGHVQRFLTKPWDDDELKHILRETAREIRVQRQIGVQIEAPAKPFVPKSTTIRRDESGAILLDEVLR